MRILTLALLICFGLISSAFAQLGVDISTARANPKTCIFDDDKHTVHGYIYNTLKSETSCCGNDAIYLEVKFNEQGIVTSAKTLTGKNDCYKKSVLDIVKRVRWDAKGVNGMKTIYFEVKPILPCSGSPSENQYVSIESSTGTSSGITEVISETVTEDFSDEEDEFADEVIEEVAEVEEMVEEEVEEMVEEVEEFVEEEIEEVVEEEVEEVVEEVAEVEEVVEESTEDWGTSTDDFLSDGGSSTYDNSSSSNSTATTVTTTTTSPKRAAKYTGPVKIPAQADIKYVSKGERSPTDDHRDSFVNVPGQQISNPKYREGETQLARQIRTELRKTGYCGLAQAAFELTIDPAGNVIDTRILAVNNDKIKEIVPGIISAIKFKPAGYQSNYRSYHQFKTVLICNGDEKGIDLDNVPNIIRVSGN